MPREKRSELHQSENGEEDFLRQARLIRRWRCRHCDGISTSKARLDSFQLKSIFSTRHILTKHANFLASDIIFDPTYQPSPPASMNIGTTWSISGSYWIKRIFRRHVSGG